MRLRLGLAAAFVLAANCSFGETLLDNTIGLVGATIGTKWSTYTWQPLTGYRVAFQQKDAYFVLRLPAGTSFAGKTHVDLRVRNNQAKPALLETNVSSNNGAGWMSSLAVLGPNEVANVTVPLYEAEQYGLRALPTPLDTTAHQTRSLGNIFPNDVRGIYFYSKDTSPADITFEFVGTAVHNVPLTGFVDTFGQQRLINWTGKVNSQADLQANINNEPDGLYPYSADEYGGVAGGKNYGVSDRFRTVKDGNNWYLVTPAGNRFFSVGVNEVGSMAWTPVSGRESMFTDLANLQAQFATHFTTREGKLGFIPYAINLQRKYGTNWKAQAIELFPKRLRSWGFNTVGVNAWDALMSQRNMPSTFGISLWSPHAKLYVYGGKTLSDPFDPTFVSAAKSDITRRLTEVSVNHPNSIGVFVDNELPWGQQSSMDSNKRFAIAKAAFNAPASASGKKLIALLKQKYVTIEALNAAWSTTYASWTVLCAGNITLPSPGTADMQTDLKSFSRKFANQYFQIIDQTISSTGYRGLYLGCRFTRLDYTPEVIAAAKTYADVLSFNIYHGFPSRTNPDLRNMDFPVMISEFSFGANDRGRVGMPLYPTLTETSRIDTYRRFFTDVKSWPNMVGVHWYRWDDFPATAKLDHDNMQDGLVSITDTFYTEFQAQTRKSTMDYMKMLQAAP